MKYLYNNDMRKGAMDKGRSQTRISGKVLVRYFALNEALFSIFRSISGRKERKGRSDSGRSIS